METTSLPKGELRLRASWWPATCRKEGVEICTASTGQEGFGMLDEFSPDVVILDLLMAEMGGLEFLQRFRSSPTHPDVPVIVVTARG